MNKDDHEKQTARANAAQQRRTTGQQRAADFDWDRAIENMKAMLNRLDREDRKHRRNQSRDRRNQTND